MSFPRRTLVLIAAGVLTAAILAGAAMHGVLEAKVEAAEPLSAYAPQGALLAVESPDFATLLAAWTNSEEEKLWLKSDSYEDFSHSRLFSRLGEAQSEFAASAGLAPDANLLSQVAGKESLFAWYDIGKLEFLYVTRMKSGEAASNPLMKLADKFQMRKAGADSFYVRAETAPGDQESQAGSTGGARTVAFAVHGDLLLLATREDLIAKALLLAQRQGDATLRTEPWYLAATGAIEAEATSGAKNAATPDMRMTLNLASIVSSPYFRSYWVQRNVSEMKQYSVGVVDLYRTKETFREERALVRNSPDAEIVAGDLGSVVKYLPAESGVYRATAVPGTTEIIAELDRRLISRGAFVYRDPHIAPAASLTDVLAGSSNDLDTRIDEQPVPELPRASSLNALREMIDSVHPGSMLVYTAVGPNGDQTSRETDPVFLPVHAAVVISAATRWDATAAQRTLTEALGAQLTVGGVGLGWQAREQDGEDWTELSGMQPLAMAVRGEVLIVASDASTLMEMLRSAKTGGQRASEYSHTKTVAGFSHSATREPLLRLSRLLDRDHASTGGTDPNSGMTSPAFFSGGMGSLSETFKRLDAETFVERPSGDQVVRQTVTYRWRP